MSNPIVIEEDGCPNWAIAPAFGRYMQRGAQLCTRDGRVVGNAVVLELAESHVFPIARCITDAGSEFDFIEAELREQFHEPKWIMDPNTAPGLRSKKDGLNE